MNGDAARKLLERMRNSKVGWGQKDFERLFEGFGFRRKGTKHDIYIHSEYPDFRMSVPRHNTLKEWVAREAVKLIDELIQRREDDNGKNPKKS